MSIYESFATSRIDSSYLPFDKARKFMEDSEIEFQK